MFDIEEWNAKEWIAAIISAGLVLYGISYGVRYLQWRYGAPKLEADNEEIDEDKIRFL